MYIVYTIPCLYVACHGDGLGTTVYGKRQLLAFSDIQGESETRGVFPSLYKQNITMMHTHTLSRG